MRSPFDITRCLQHWKADDGCEGKARDRSRWSRDLCRNLQREELAEALRCRVRYFTDGAVLGSKEFVQSWFEAHRDERAARRRAAGPHSMQGSDWSGLCVIRGLRRSVFS